ncbi:MAG: bacillithiol biosynthesis cysteine-adding enzyme BshC [Bacteroidota bacterium]
MILNSTPSNIKEAYLSEHPSLRPFYQYPIQQIDFAQVIADKSREDIDRKLLQRVIREQYGDLPLSPKSQQHLEWLGQDNCFTITTGHQLVLYGGPLFTTYKVLSAAKLAQHLNDQLDAYRFVPIFWIHTEDHDFEEINHYYPSFGQKKTYKGNFQSQVGTHLIESSIAELGPSSSWASHYKAGSSWTDAFRSLSHALFDSYGVLMLDADHPELKAVFRPVVEQELLDSLAYRSVSTQSQKLVEAQYKQQISPREINLFYLDESGRDRITREGENFSILNRKGQLSQADMLQIVQDHPERFSPNVSLRPLYQEMILPNLAYFGGWGELSYWLQLKELFDQTKVNFPVVLPRFSATIFEHSELEAWKALGFDPADIHLPLHKLHQQLLPAVWEDTELIRHQQAILAQIDSMTRYIGAEISPTLAKSTIALRVRAQKHLQRIQKKAGKVMRNRFPTTFQEAERLKIRIQPDGQVQERVLGVFSFPEISPERLVEMVWQAVEPLKFEHQYLVIEEL